MKGIKTIIALLLCVMMCLTLLAGCGGGQEQDNSATEEKIITYGLSGAWTRLMPYDMVGMNSIIPNEKIFDRLVGFDNEDIIYYRAAKSIDLSDDKLTFTVHLNEESKWHDGEPVTAYDWEWTFKTMALPEFEGYGNRGYLAYFAGTDESGTGDIQIKAIDDYTLEMKIKEPCTPEAFFGAYCYYYYVLPKHLLEDIPVEELGTCDFWDNPIGSGPCKFISQEEGYEVVLEPFEDYYLGKPQFDKLIYRVMSDKSLSAGLLAGEFDTGWATVAANEAVETLDGNNGIHAELMDNKNYLKLNLNNELFPAEVRHAFEIAIDKQLIVDSVLEGYGSVTCSYIMPSSKYYNNDLVFERDIVKAKELLDKNNFDYSRTYSLAAASAENEKVAVIISQNLAEIGVKVSIESCDNATLLAGARDGTYDMSIGSTTTLGSPTYYMLNLNPDAITYSRVNDGELYNMLLDINLETDEDKKIEMAKEMQEKFYEQSPYIGLCFKDIYMVLSSKLNNVDIPNNDKCWEWEVS